MFGNAQVVSAELHHIRAKLQGYNLCGGRGGYLVYFWKTQTEYRKEYYGRAHDDAISVY